MNHNDHLHALAVLAQRDRRDWPEVDRRIAASGVPTAESTGTAYPNPWGAYVNDDGQIVVDDFTRDIQSIPEIVRAFSEQNEGYWIERVYNSTGWTITGGALGYSVNGVDDHFLQAGANWAPRAPGAEAPHLAGTRRRRILTEPENLSGRIEVTDEARRTNNVADVQRDFQQASNSFSLSLQTRGEDALDALIETEDRIVWGGNNTFTEWDESPVVNSTTAVPFPGREFARVQRTFFEELGGIQADTLMWSPADAELFYNIYAERGDNVLAQHGIRQTLRSVRLDAGARRYLRSGQVGWLAWEKPMDTEEVREGLRKTDTYVMDGSFVFVANGADAILEVRDEEEA
jgi:hypothetical protein